MKIDVLFSNGSKRITVHAIPIGDDEAARLPIEHRGVLYQMMVWRINAGDQLTIVLMPHHPKHTWRWSGRLRRGRVWTKLLADESSSRPPWSCQVRRS